MIDKIIDDYWEQTISNLKGNNDEETQKNIEEIKNKKTVFVEDDPVGEEISHPNPDAFGRYIPMSSKGHIVIEIINHLGFAEKFLCNLIKDISKIDDDGYKILFNYIVKSSVNITFLHECFHHAIDILRKLNQSLNKNKDPEESLAVIYSLIGFYPVHFKKNINHQILKDLFAKRFDYHGVYDITRYKNNDKFDTTKFVEELSKYVNPQGTNDELQKELILKVISNLGAMHTVVYINYNGNKLPIEPIPVRKSIENDTLYLSLNEHRTIYRFNNFCNYTLFN